MARQTVEIPQEFTDDIRWYKYFTQPMIIAIAICGMIDTLIVLTLSSYNLLIPGLILSAILMLAVLALISFPMPGAIMSGGGMLLYQYVYLRLRHRGIRKIYLRMEDDYFDQD